MYFVKFVHAIHLLFNEFYFCSINNKVNIFLDHALVMVLAPSASLTFFQALAWEVALPNI